MHVMMMLVLFIVPEYARVLSLGLSAQQFGCGTVEIRETVNIQH